MNLFIRNKIFLRIFHFIVIFVVISIIYKIIIQIPILIQSSIFINTDLILNISFNSENENKCSDKSRLTHRTLRNVIRRDDTLNYLGFVLRSHSLFYCSVPKVGTRTFLTFLTYLHIRDDLIPLLTNNSKSDILNIPYLNQTILSSFKNHSQTTTYNSLSFLQLFSSQLSLVNQSNSSKLDLWSVYQNQLFPFSRLRTLSDPSSLFSSNFLRVIFVRHPFERLASAYIDKISSLGNKPFSLYDSLRRAICRKYSSSYLTPKQKSIYRIHKGLAKQDDEPCQKIIPTFEHFIDYLKSDSLRDDVHWKPYSTLCRVCLFKYNFIGKFESIEEDLRRLLIYLGLKSNDWINEYYFKTGKTKENYKLMFSNLNQKLICFLKDFYKEDFKLFNYRMEDYLTNNITIQCPKIFYRNYRRKT